MTAQAQYDCLVSMLEQLGGVTDTTLQALVNAKGDKRLMPSSVASLAKAVSSSPLYVFSDSAVSRCREIASEGKLSKLPVVPVAGAVLVDSTSAVFMRQKDVSAEALSSILHIDPQAISSSWECVFAQSERLPNGQVESERLTYLSSVRLFEGTTSGYQFPSIAMVTRHRDSTIGIFAEVFTAAGCCRSNLRLDRKFRSVGKMPQPSEDDMQEFRKALAQHPMAALEQLQYVDLPAHYVVEERPDSVPADRPEQAGSEKKAARYDRRERWVIMDPEEICVRMTNRSDKPAVGTHASPLPHLRRSHSRTLRSDRYKFRKGEVINVRPTWVGDREWAQRDGRMQYRVISRLGANENQA
jgi:hypothetical protein